MPSDTRPTSQTAQSPNVVDTIDPELLAQFNAKRDSVSLQKWYCCNLIFIIEFISVVVLLYLACLRL